MHVFITGTSRGLGYELAKTYLDDGDFVTGIGRKTAISHKKYNFSICDLSDWNLVDKLQIEIKDNSEVLLINNAGIIGEINRIGNLSIDFSRELFQVNTVAPIQLCRKFIQECDSKNVQLTILNISSGAGRRAIPSWANYCASKAALDLFSETVQLEEIERGKKTKIYSLAPGVIDTNMQKEIRNTDEHNFSSQKKFKELHTEKLLQNPSILAQKIKHSIKNNSLKNVICKIH